MSSQLKEAEVWVERGDEFLKQQDTEKAIECYTRAINLNPRLAHAFFKRGNIFVMI